MKIRELEYKGLNLVDEIGTVEIGLDIEHNRVHLFDMQQIVSLEYDYMRKSYVLSEGFHKMASVLMQKQFFSSKESLINEQWIQDKTWYFYCPNRTIKIYRAGTITVVSENELKNLSDSEAYLLGIYNKYAIRLVS